MAGDIKAFSEIDQAFSWLKIEPEPHADDNGPFGEFPKYYSPQDAREVIEVTRVTHRRDPIFHTIIPAEMEHLLLGAIPREASMLLHLQRSFPNVTDVHLAVGGVCRYHLVVQMKKHREGEPKNVMMGAFGGHYDIKRVVVVDEDVDIHNDAEVEWALATRFQPDRDLMVVNHSQGSLLDPSTQNGGIGGKWGLDATKPLRYEGVGQEVRLRLAVHEGGVDDHQRHAEMGGQRPVPV